MERRVYSIFIKSTTAIALKDHKVCLPLHISASSVWLDLQLGMYLEDSPVLLGMFILGLVNKALPPVFLSYSPSILMYLPPGSH